MNSARPNDPLSAARAAISAGRYDEAASVCRSVLNGMSDNGSARALLAAVDLQTGKVPEAIEDLKRIAAQQANCYDAFYWLASGLMKAGRFEEGLEVGRQIVLRWPRSPDGLNTVGQCGMALQRYPEAQDAYEKLAALAPNSPPVHYNLSTALMRQARYQEAEREARIAVDLKPANALPYSHLAELLALLDNTEEAAAYYRRAFEMSPTSIMGRLNLARAEVHGKELEAAERTLTEVIGDFPDEPSAYSLLGSLLQLLGRFEDAAVALRTAMEKDPDQVRNYLELAFCTKFKESDSNLIRQMEEAKSRTDLTDDSRASICYALGKAYDDTKQYESAMREYDEANRIMLRVRTEKIDRIARTKRADQVIKTFTPEFFADKQSLGSDSEVPVFIVGMIRSGTTLTEQILSSHPEISGAGELDFWTRNAIDGFLEPEQSAPEWATKAKADYSAILEENRGGRKLVTDKMPLNFHSLGPIHTLFPKARIIHCKRHPVDNCISIYVTRFRGGLNFGHDRETIVFAYEEYLRLIDHFRQVIPEDRFLDIRYEDLVQDREAATRRMIEFCGLLWDDACLSYQANERVVTTPSVWQARQPVYSTSMERWRNYAPWLGEFRNLLTEPELASIS